MKRLIELLFNDMGKVKEIGDKDNDNSVYYMPKEILLKFFTIALTTETYKKSKVVMY